MSRSHPLVLLFLAAFLFVTLPVAAQDESTAFAPRNVILFIPDGFGPSMATMARDYRRDYLREGSSLAMDAIETGSVRTFSTSQRVTDSAAGATAFATGVKSYNGAISVDTTGQPVGTVLEAARRKGMLTGVVTTTRVTHATPAAFTAHVPRRAMESEIAEQQLVTRPDIIMGGGAQFFLPEDKGGRRTDNRDLIDEADALGYTVARSLADVRSANTIPLLALLAMDQMAYEVDRDETAEPSLAEMTAKSLELLGDHPEGFFLMVEAARIDHAAHGNDAAGTLHDVLAFDAALNVALDFARRDG
ncbi:MAG: alkaline phosphatase, partial [Bacteroidota bacterium]